MIEYFTSPPPINNGLQIILCVSSGDNEHYQCFTLNILRLLFFSLQRFRLGFIQIDRLHPKTLTMPPSLEFNLNHNMKSQNYIFTRKFTNMKLENDQEVFGKIYLGKRRE